MSEPAAGGVDSPTVLWRADAMPRFLLLFCLGYGLGFAALVRLASLLPDLALHELWYPAAGLRFALMLRYGSRVAIPALLSEVIVLAAFGEFAAGAGLDKVPALLSASLSPLVYAIVIWFVVRRPRVALTLDRYTNLLWIGAAAVIASALSAIVSTALVPHGPAIGSSSHMLAATIAWLRELLGILILAPVFLALVQVLEGRMRPRWNGSLVFEIIIALAIGALLVTFVGATSRFVHWYPALLPVLWLAVRHGWTGAVVAVLAVALATIANVASAATPAARLEIQLFLLLQSGIGLLLGGLSTSRARMAANLKVRETALAHLERLSLLGQMAASLAHEIAQPLSAISVFARAGSDSTADAARQGEALRLIGKEAERLKAIIQRTRALSQNKPPRLRPVDLRAAITDLEPLLLLEASRYQASLHLELSKHAPMVQADEVQLQQVLLNLVRNAVEAVKDQPAESRIVIVRVAPPRHGQVEIAVIDRGHGLSEDELALMFKPFIGKTASGLGLGLAISRTIVEAHGGRLWAERPRSGPGLRLCFSLPTCPRREAS